MFLDYVPAILMFVLFALDVPIAFAIAISALSFFFIDGDIPLNIFVQKMVSATDSYPLLAIPFFVMTGAIMNSAGITRRLLAFADAMVGHMTGRWRRCARCWRRCSAASPPPPAPTRPCCRRRWASR